MASCRFCDTETQLYDNGRPACLRCAELLESRRRAPRNQPPNWLSVPGERGKSPDVTSDQKLLTVYPTPRPGYTLIDEVSQMAPDSAAWIVFMEDVVKMPFSMLEAVQYAVRAKKWRSSNNPLMQVRTAAENWAARRNRLAGSDPYGSPAVW